MVAASHNGEMPNLTNNSCILISSTSIFSFSILSTLKPDNRVAKDVSICGFSPWDESKLKHNGHIHTMIRDSDSIELCK